MVPQNFVVWHLTELSLVHCQLSVVDTASHQGLLRQGRESKRKYKVLLTWVAMGIVADWASLCPKPL